MHRCTLPFLYTLVLTPLCTAATIYEWSDDGNNNSWNNSGNWRNSSGNIPEGTGYGAWFNSARNAGTKCYVTNEQGTIGTARSLHTYKFSGTGTGDNWRIYANKGEVSNSAVSVTLYNLLDTNLTGGSSANLYHTLNIASGNTVTWNSTGANLILNEPLGGSGNLDGDTTAGGGITLKTAGSFSGNLYTGKNEVDIDHVNALQNAHVVLEDTADNRLSYLDGTNLGAISGSGKLNLASGTSLNVGSKNSNTTLSGIISGSGNLVKKGTGTLIINNSSNTHSGQMTIDAGKIRVGSLNAFTNSEIVTNLNNGFDPSFYTGISTNTLTIGGLSGSGNLDIGTATLAINGSSSSNYTGTLSGTGGKLEVKSGTFKLAGPATYDGLTTISGGSFRIINQDNLTTFSNGLAMSGSGNLSLVDCEQTIANIISSSGNSSFSLDSESVLNIGGSQDITFAGGFSGDSTDANPNILRKIGSGKLTLAKGNTFGNSFSGEFYIDAGTVSFGDGTNPSRQAFYATGGGANSIIVNNGTIELNTPTADTFLLGANISGSGNLVVTEGTNYLSQAYGSSGANNTYTGTTTLNGGTLLLSHATELGSGALIFNGGTLGFDTTNIGTFSDLTSSVFAANGKNVQIDLTKSGHNMLFDLALSHSGGFQKLGAGKLRMNKDHSFTGTTTIGEGTLQLGNGGTTGSLASTSLINNGTLAINRSNNISLGADISGTGSLEKLGSNTLTLTGSTTYSGGTTISAGKLVAGQTSGESWNSGNISNSGTMVFAQADPQSYTGVISGTGALQVDSGAQITLTQNQTYTGGTQIKNGALTLGSGSGNITLQGSVIVDSDGTLGLNLGGTQEFKTDVSGAGSLLKSNTNQIWVTSDLTHTGGTVIDSGVLEIGRSNTSGSLAGDVETNGTLSFNRTDNITFAGVISGTGNLSKKQSNALTLTAASTHSGNTQVSAGTLILGNALALQNSSVNLQNSAVLDLTTYGVDAYCGSLGTSSNASILLGTKRLYIGDGSNANNTSLLASITATTGGITTTAPAGNGRITLNIPVNYTGQTVVNGRYFFLQNGNELASTTVVCNRDNAVGGNATTIELGGLSGDGDLGSKNYIVGGNNESTSYGGSMSGNDKTLTKKGTGTLTITGTNQRSSTTVEAGKLVLNNTSGSALGNGTVQINSGATLGGSGSTAGSITCAGTVSPGNSPGTLTTGADFTLTGSYLCEIDGASSDQLAVTGNLDISAGSLNISTLAGGATQDIYIIATYGTLTGTFSSISGMPADYEIDYDYQGNSIALINDRTAPEITLNGDESITLSIGASWSDPGAEATDNIDETVSVTVGGDTVDPNTPGTYTITYDAADAAGNDAEQKSRTVTVLSKFQEWASDKGLTPGVNDAMTDDPDNDGNNNAKEFALDGDPLSASDQLKIRNRIVEDTGNQYLMLTLPVRTGASFGGSNAKSATIDGVVYLIEGSSELSDFSATVVEHGSADSAGMPSLSSGYTYRTFRLSGNVDSASKGFLKLSVSPAP